MITKGVVLISVSLVEYSQQAIIAGNFKSGVDKIAELHSVVFGAIVTVSIIT